MKQVQQHNIDYHMNETDLHNQNSVEGVIL